MELTKRSRSPSLLNRTRAKRLILDTAAELGKGKKFTRVGSESYEWLEGVIRTAVRNEVRGHPTIGKTLYLGGKRNVEPTA